jgi:acyl carrier protein
MAEVKTIRQTVLEAVARNAGVPVEAVRPDQNLEGHGFDSLDSFELVMELEELLNILVPDEDSARLIRQPVQELVAYLEARRAAAVA